MVDAVGKPKVSGKETGGGSRAAHVLGSLGSVNIDDSSQFLSALLIVSCLCGSDFTTRIEGTHGMSYIEVGLSPKGAMAARVMAWSEQPDISAVTP